MLSNEVINKLNEAAEYAALYPDTAIYVLKKIGGRGVKFFSLKNLANKYVRHDGYTWLVYMTKDGEFLTNNEATNWFKEKLESLRYDTDENDA